MDRTVFILNPTAGKKDRTQELTALINEIMASYDTPYEIFVTAAAGDGERRVREVCREEPDRQILFVACGGDGTLNEVVNGAYGFRNAVITHFPCGSGNDFVKTFSERTASFYDMNKLLAGSERTLDVIFCSGRYGLSLASVGLDARVAAKVPELKRLPLISGPGAYTLSIVINLFKKISRHYRLTLDGVTEENDYVIAVAANGTHYGGGYCPIPEAKPDDSVLEFLFVPKLSRATLVRIIGKYKQGRYREIMKYVERRAGTSLTIEADEPTEVNLDGEIYRSTKIDICLIPGAIRFLLPDLPAEEAAKSGDTAPETASV